MSKPPAARRPGLRGQLVGTFVTEGFNFGAGILISVLSTRLMGPEGKGVYAAATSAALIAASVASLGLGKSLLSLFNREGRRSEVIGGTLALLPGMVLAGTVILLFTLPAGVPALSPLAVCTVILLAASVTNGLLEGLLRATRDVRTVNRASGVQTGAQLVVIVGAALLLLGDPWIMMACAAFAALARGGILAVSLLRQPEMRPSFENLRASVKPLLTLGLTYQVYSNLWALHVRQDLLIAGWMMAPAQAGFYAAAGGLAQMLWRVPTVVGMVTIPYMSQLKTEADATAFAALTSRLGALSLGVAALVAGVVAGPVIVAFYGESFRDAVLPMRVLLPGVVSSGLYLLIAGSLVARGRLRPLLIVGAVTTGLNALLNVALQPSFGAVGAAFSSTISYSASLAGILLYLWRFENQPPHRFLVPRTEDFRLLRKRAPSP